MAKKKTYTLNPSTIKRLKRNGGQQPRHGECIICGGDWDVCPHNRVQTGLLEDAYRLAPALGLLK